MAESVTIHDAKTQFSKLVRRAEAGEEIVVRRGREPVARIVPLAKRRVRGFGSMKGEVRMVSEEEMARVDEEIAEMFEESAIFPGEKSRPHSA